MFIFYNLVEGLHVNSNSIFFQGILNVKKISKFMPFFPLLFTSTPQKRLQALQIDGDSCKLSLTTTQIKEACECVACAS